jgi:transcriptional regulator with XRE-family HTH domain
MAKPTKNQESSTAVEDPDDITRIIARRLRELREKSGLSQTLVAERSGIKQTYIYELEYGTSNPTVKTLHKLAQAMNIDIRDVFPGSPLAGPTGGDLRELHRMLDGLTTTINEHIANEQLRVADEQRRFDAEIARRKKSQLTLVQELQAFEELRDGLARLIRKGTSRKPT